METNIIQVDLAEIDRDILEAQKRLDILMSAKKYAQSKNIAIKSVVSSNIQIVTPHNNNMGVSDFIMSLLTNNDKTDTRVIIQSYADHTHKKYDEVRGNVSNALSRLKKAKQIKNEVKSGGRKAGSLWILIK